MSVQMQCCVMGDVSFTAETERLADILVTSIVCLVIVTWCLVLVVFSFRSVTRLGVDQVAFGPEWARWTWSEE